jgi:hypothetical protein
MLSFQRLSRLVPCWPGESTIPLMNYKYGVALFWAMCVVCTIAFLLYLKYSKKLV